MDIERFVSSIANAEPPAGLTPLLRALWHDARGEWARAHEIVQGEKGREAAAVHAYLHRKEGDLGNADYWYGRAGASRPGTALAAEWRELAVRLLGRDAA
jgi:hypothetical protein